MYHLALKQELDVNLCAHVSQIQPSCNIMMLEVNVLQTTDTSKIHICTKDSMSRSHDSWLQFVSHRGIFLKDTWGYFQPCLWRPKPAISPGKSDHLHLWSWRPKEVFWSQTVTFLLLFSCDIWTFLTRLLMWKTGTLTRSCPGYQNKSMRREKAQITTHTEGVWLHNL